MKTVSIVVCGALLFGTLGDVAPAKARTRVTNTAFNYSCIVPEGWTVESTSDVTFMYNVPVSQLGPQGLLPDGGAAIALDPIDLPEWQKMSINELAALTVGGSKSRIERNVHVPNPVLIGLIRMYYELALEGRPTQRRVAYLFKLGERTFAVGLRFNLGDRNGRNYERALVDVLNSIRPERE